MTDLLLALRARGPVSPAVQMRMLLEFGRERDWVFEVAWRWSFERVRWPHDTTARREWKQVLGEAHDDPRGVPAAHRACWQRAYERLEATKAEQAGGRLLVAA